MSDKKGLDNLDIKARVKEINIIKYLWDEFGQPAFRAVRKYHFSTGYQKGYELLNYLIKKNEFSKDQFWNAPVKGVEIFLTRYFQERGGNMPEIWYENDTVYLKTAADVFCVTEAAEKKALRSHKDICNIYCRSFVEGLISIFEEVFPGLVIHFYNVSSRRDVKRSDCVEAFQIKHF